MDNLRELSSHYDLTVSLDPAGDGDCQFAALVNQLNKLGIFKSAHVLREEAVSHIESFKEFYSEFIFDESVDDYITKMRRKGTFGDHLTLTALAREYNVQIYIHSTR